MFSTPFQFLAAFAIVYVVGLLTSICFGAYINKVKRDARRAAM